MATAGSMNWPPSENESGVTLRMPMTSGRPSVSNRARASGGAGGVSVMVRACAMPVALRGRAGAVKPTRAGVGCSVRNLDRQLLGVFDPAADDFLGRQQPHHFQLLVGGRHRFRQFGRVAVFEFLHGADAGCQQQLGIFLADAPDASAVAAIGPAQPLLLLDVGLEGQFLASLQRAARPRAGARSNGFPPTSGSRQLRRRCHQYR